MLLTLKEVMVYKNLSHPLNFGLDFLVQQQANLDYSGDQPQIIIRDTSYPLASTIDPHETKFLRYTGPASAAADRRTERSTASVSRTEGSAAADHRTERSTAAEKQQTAYNQMSTFSTFKELIFNNPAVPLMVAALAPSSFEGTSAVNIGKEPNLTDKDSLKFKSTEVKLEGISKSEKCVQDGPYFIEVNKKNISQASVKKPPWVLSSVQVKLPKVDQLPSGQPPETEICRTAMPPGQRKERMELGEG